MKLEEIKIVDVVNDYWTRTLNDPLYNIIFNNAPYISGCVNEYIGTRNHIIYLVVKDMEPQLLYNIIDELLEKLDGVFDDIEEQKYYLSYYEKLHRIIVSAIVTLRVAEDIWDDADENKIISEYIDKLKGAKEETDISDKWMFIPGIKPWETEED